jgi:hypothetical protein
MDKSVQAVSKKNQLEQQIQKDLLVLSSSDDSTVYYIRSNKIGGLYGSIIRKH